ncbi:MAG: DUF6022 family protein [Chloroflexota bacterium]
MVAEQWQQVAQDNHDQLLQAFDTIGEGAAYGMYAQMLFHPIQRQMKNAGLTSKPSFPGTLTTSRKSGQGNRVLNGKDFE